MSSSESEAISGATRVLQAFVDANTRGDGDGMRACLTRTSLEAGGFAGPQEGAVFSLGEATVEGAHVIIPIRMRPLGVMDDEGPSQELQAVMIQEDGAWKFDLVTSQERMMSAIEGALGGAMQEMADAMGQAMEGIAGAMSEAFGGEQEEALSWEHVPLEPSSSDLHSLPDMQPLERLQEAMSAAVGFPVAVTADLPALLSVLGTDDAATLVDWLQQQLLVGWPAYFSSLAEGTALNERLRGIRIEGAVSADERFIAADLNDVVYRMYPADESGYYSDEEILRVLAGVLANLASPMNAASGQLSVFPDYAVPTRVDEYAATSAPRCMRRISEMVRRNVALEVDWHQFEYISGPMLLRWGLERVVGGVALALMDEELGAEVREGLRKIKFWSAYSMSERKLVYEDGVLEFWPALTLQEAGSFWEVDVEDALAGTPILPANDEMAAFAAASDVAVMDDGDEPDEIVNNDTLFAEAVASLETTVPTWQMQVEMALGHPTPLVVDWGSLDGRFDLVQGMVHVGVVQSLAAICEVGFNPATKQALAGAVKSVKIMHVTGVDAGDRVQIEDGRLLFLIDAAQEVTGPPDGSLAQELKRAIGVGGDEAAVVDAEVDPQAHGQAALGYMARLEEAMRAAELWPGEPPEQPVQVRGAFGCENMAFEQWLAWVLIPRVKSIVESGDTFPSGSMVGTYAVRAFDGVAADEVIGVLYEFDQFINKAGAGR